MQKILLAGIVVIVIGSTIYFAAGILDYHAFGGFIEGFEENDTDAVKETYVQQRTARIVASVGLFVALIGVAMGFAGTAPQSQATIKEEEPPLTN
ncbi:MAG: hypothetical protein ACE5IO_08100 [Thermoplasmata archaeon]